jgi:hypothetical protein
MTETVEDMGSLDRAIKKAASASRGGAGRDPRAVVAAKARGEDLTGPEGLGWAACAAVDGATSVALVSDDAGRLVPASVPHPVLAVSNADGVTWAVTRVVTRTCGNGSNWSSYRVIDCRQSSR